MKRQNLKLTGITAIVIILMLLPGMARADIDWYDPVILDFDVHNKNKWVSETPITIQGSTFNTMALLIDTEETPPSNVAEIQIKGLFGKEYVNLTYNLTGLGQWNIIYLSAPIVVNNSDNYTLKVVIKENSKAVQPEESQLVGTRADIGDSVGPVDLILFKIGALGVDSGASSTPLLDTGGATGDVMGDSIEYPGVDGAEPSDVNVWAFIGGFLIIAGLVKVNIGKIHPGFWFVIGLLMILISGGWI